MTILIVEEFSIYGTCCASRGDEFNQVISIGCFANDEKLKKFIQEKIIEYAEKEIVVKSEWIDEVLKQGVLRSDLTDECFCGKKIKITPLEIDSINVNLRYGRAVVVKKLLVEGTDHKVLEYSVSNKCCRGTGSRWVHLVSTANLSTAKTKEFVKDWLGKHAIGITDLDKIIRNIIFDRVKILSNLKDCGCGVILSVQGLEYEDSYPLHIWASTAQEGSISSDDSE